MSNVINHEAKTSRLVAKLHIVIVVSRWMPMDRLPSMEKLMKKDTKDLPRLAIRQVATIQCHFPDQPEPIMALVEVAVATPVKPVHAKRHLGNFEFKLTNESFRPQL